MAERTELASHIVRRHASFDSDQAPRHIGEPGRDPAAGNLLPQNDCPLVVEADQMQGVLACIDANGVSDCSGCLMGHGDVLLVLLGPRSSSERFGAGARPVHPIRISPASFSRNKPARAFSSCPIAAAQCRTWWPGISI